MTPEDLSARVITICRRHAAIRTAYLVQLTAPLSAQTTSPVLALEVVGELSKTAFDDWPRATAPMVVILLNDDVWSRLIRLTRPIYSNVAHAVATAVGGKVVDLPSDDHTTQFAIEMPDGTMPILVRDFGAAIGVSILGGRYWHLRSAADQPNFVTEVAAEVGKGPAIGILRRAHDLANILAAEFDERWSISIPGVNDPHEMWLRGPVSEAAAIGVFRGRELSVEDAIGRVRRQRAAFVTHTQLGEQLEAIANKLAPLVAKRLPGDWYVAIHGFTSHEGAKTASIVAKFDGKPEIVIRVEDGTIRGHAGVVGDDGWDGELVPTKLAEIADAMVTAIEHARRTLQIDDLRVGKRYRVIDGIQELVTGSIVQYTMFDDVDNHYGIYVFTDEAGNERRVHGDCSTPRNGPLGQIHRYLAPLT